ILRRNFELTNLIIYVQLLVWILASAAFLIEIDDFLKRRKPSVVHIRPGQSDVPQRGDFKRTFRALTRDFGATQVVGLAFQVRNPVDAESAVGKIRQRVALETAHL